MRKKSAVAMFSLGAVGVVAACSSSSGDLGLGGDDTEQPGADGGGTLADGSISGQDSGPANTDSGPGTPLDAGPDARAEPSCVGLAYCENFEDYTDAGVIKNNAVVGPWKASVGANGSMAIDSVQPYGGTKSLHIKGTAGDTSSSQLLTKSVASGGVVTGNDLFGRAMVYYSNAGGAGLPNGHTWTFIAQGLSSESGKTMNLNLTNDGAHYGLNYHGDTATMAENASPAGGTAVAGKWVCMQWQYNASGATPVDEGKVWADGVLVTDGTKAGQTWNLADPFTSFQFGFTHYPNLDHDIDMYIDDFALNNAMIACPP